MSAPGLTEGNDALRVQVRKRFLPQRGAGDAFGLEVDLTLDAGITILFGASGAGKTTLLDCIAGLQTPDAGRIAVGQAVVFDSAAGVNLAPNRRGAGYLLQSLALFPHMSVRQNVQYGLHGLASSERDARCGEILDSFRLAALAQRRPAELSGGERQRAALARTLVLRPRVLLLDEPLTALDAKVKAQMVDDLRAWNAQQRIPILYVTHQREEVFALGERVVALVAGRVVAQGSAHDVLHRPQLETVAQLAGFENVFECAFVAAHPEQGTMTCRIEGSGVELEVPLSRIDQSRPVRVGIRAGDILLASSAPQGLSARNVFAGVIGSLEQRDIMVVAKVDCGAVFEVHITPAARESLRLRPESYVWLVLKTHSCQVWQGSG